MPGKRKKTITFDRIGCPHTSLDFSFMGGCMTLGGCYGLGYSEVYSEAKTRLDSRVWRALKQQGDVDVVADYGDCCPPLVAGQHPKAGSGNPGPATTRS